MNPDNITLWGQEHLKRNKLYNEKVKRNRYLKSVFTPGDGCSGPFCHLGDTLELFVKLSSLSYSIGKSLSIVDAQELEEARGFIKEALNVLGVGF